MQTIAMNLFELDLLCDACDTYITEAEVRSGNLPEEFQAAAIINTERIRARLMEAASAEIESGKALV